MQFMQVITSLLLAAFAGYIGAWYFGALEAISHSCCSLPPW